MTRDEEQRRESVRPGESRGRQATPDDTHRVRHDAGDYLPTDD
jgi:hypothetical protein